MKKFYVLLMIWAFCAGTIYAHAGFEHHDGREIAKSVLDDVEYNGNIYLSSQADVDQFSVNYPGVTSITGELRISDSSDITSLAGLNTVTSVGYLSIYANTSLSDLSGLNNLTTILYDCYIGNTGVTAMSGLNGVTSIGGNLMVQTYGTLQSLSGFNALQSVSNLYIYYNYDLTSIPQFLSLTSANYVAIYENTQLAVCDSPGLCNVLDTASADIFSNAAGCNTIQQLQSDCGLPITCSDVYLYSQADVDNFSANFGCSIITGTLYITGNDVTNLNGLSSVTKVGNLDIYDVPALTNFSGLNNLSTITQDLNIGGATAATVNALSGVTTIGGSVNISSCYNLVNFLGLSNVTSIGGNLYITHNSLLTALPGMINLTTVGGNLSIQGDDALIGLSGLNNLTSVGQGISISYNGALTNISALSNLQTMNGTLEFYNNNSLLSLSGIDNLSGMTYLYITYSPLLSVCSVPSVCTYLENGGGASIYGNAPGCGNYNQVRVGCGEPQNCGYVSLYSQEDVDNYIYNYGCTAVETIYISGSSIQNLDGLSMITSAQSIQFSYVSGLTDVSGLSNITSLSGDLQINGETQPTFPSLPSLTSIGGNFYVEYTTMEHLPSLPNLTAIGGQFYIYSNDNLLDVAGMPLLTTIGGDLTIGSNDLLAGLSAFSSVTSVDGSLDINYNDALTGLAGLENLNPTNLNSLNIYSNPMLAICTLPNICTFLNNGGGNSISGNAIGCEDYAALAAVCNAGCPTGDVLLATQAEVNDFAVNFPTCTIVGGSVTIAGADITDLSPLSNIVSINGTLSINSNEALTSLAGLSSLATVRGDLQIYNNNVLIDLAGLAALASVEYSVNIESNASLASLNGLSNLTSVGGSVNINSNPMLTSLAALGNIASLPGGNLSVSNNDMLAGLSGLNMTSVYGSMSITGNPSLTSLTALSGLTSVQSLELSYNAVLPSAAGLSGLTSLNYATIEGNEAMTALGFNASAPNLYSLTISNNPSLTDISSLSPITTLNDLNITSNTSLTTLTGLNNLTTLSYLNISGNTALTSLAALGNLTQVYNLQVSYNDSLTSLNGLQQLADTQSTTFQISGNTLLASLSGLENLTSIYNLNIQGNPALASLSALSSLSEVRYLYLNDNDALTTLAGLENVAPSELYYLSLQSSNNLSTCDLPNICTYLTNGGSANISGNASGCNNTFDLQLACGPTGTCPTGAITFTSQSQLDQFILAYPSCTSLPSYVTISGDDITNLNGLANITYIANPLVIENNPLLTNLTGLNNLTFVGALTISNNPSLTSLAALSNLTVNCYNVSINNNDALTSLNGIQNLPIAGSISISNNDALTSLVAFNNINGLSYITISNNDALVSFGSLGNFDSIYSVTISDNNALNSLSGLAGLTYVRYISVWGNSILTNLSGIQNLDPNYLYGLSLYSSEALSTCALPNICTFLSSGGSNYITGNATGCNSSTEVQVACGNGEPPTFTAVSPTSASVCEGQNVNMTLSGLVPDSTSVLTFTFNGVDLLTENVYADASGNAPFNVTVSVANNGQTLTLVSLERIDVMTGTLTLTSDNTVALTVSPTVTYYRDVDGDTFGNLYDTVSACTGLPSGYVTNSTDCFDYDATIFNYAENVYYDDDQDGYDGGTTSVCYGDSLPPQYSLVTNGPDCNDYEPLYHEEFAFYYDADQDGYGTGNLVQACAESALIAPPYYALNNTDCSPFNPSIFTAATLYIDIDGDNYNNGSSFVCYGAAVPAGYSATTNGPDCDDNDALKNTFYPFYADADGDGYGTGSIVQACAQSAEITPVGYATNNTDCAPANANAFQQGVLYIDADNDQYDAGSQSICYGNAAPAGYALTTNGTDCNDNNAAAHTGYSFYADTDSDGYGSGSLVENVCALNATTPPPGYSLNNLDCAPTDPGIYLGYSFYADNDDDGFGAGSAVTICTASGSVAPEGYAVAGGDCNDGNASINPGVQEICNGIDDDCDGLTDDNDPSVSPASQTTYYADADQDGFGNPSVSVNACVAPSNYVTDNTDCDDNNNNIHQTFSFYVDSDGDNYGAGSLVSVCAVNASTPPNGYAVVAGDCANTNSNVNPGAQEICNGIDDDCDGLTDSDDPSFTGGQTYYADADADGFGNPAVSVVACSAPVGYITDNTDCDDADNQLYPGQIWLLDNDNDGYGTGATTVSCSRPLNGFFASELTSATGDCNDNNPMINPVAQRLEFSGATNFTSSLIAPTNGTLYTNFTFEVTYFDANNQMPPATFPRVYLDYEGNGAFNGANDRAVIMTPYDVNDTNTADGKRYIGTINGLAYGTNWQTRVQVQNGACVTEIGPFNYPDVQVQSDLQIFANDITFSSNHPAAGSPLTVNAVVHNISDFPAQNFYVKLVNQYDPGIVYGDVLVPNVPPHGTTTVTWNITTPATPAWCPMQVIVDNTNVISESDELDNTAIRPFINGNYNLLGGIEVVNVGASPTVSYITSSSDAVTVFGRGLYYGTPTPLPDPSVAGATVTFTIVETGATYSTYTNSSGYFSHSFPAPITPGVYHITGEMTDFTFLGNFTTQFERIVYVQPCTTDVWASIQTSNNTAMVADNIPPNTILAGESISGTFTVYNGCAAVGGTLLDVTQNGGSAIADVNVPALASGGSFSANFNNIVFSTPGQYTICATADGAGAISEINENNATCTTINVLPNQPDIYPYYGPSNTASVCTSNSLGFTLYNGGGAVTGSFNVDVIVRKDNIILTTLHHTVPNINALSFYGFSFPYTYASAGNYSFELQCDVPTPNGTVSEISETNNTVTYGVTASDCVFKPDLTLLGCENFDVSPVDPQFPGAVTYTATIQNSGNATAVGPIPVRFNLSGGQVYNTTYNGNIGIGQTVTVSVNTPSVASGTQTLTATVDYNNIFDEWSESNNSISNSLCWDFQPVDRVYPCGSNFWDYTQIANQPVYLSVPLNQYGMYDASSVAVRMQVSGPGLSGTIDLGNAIATNLEQTCYCPASAVLPYSFVFPEEGVYTFTMTVDPDNTYAECNESNNILIRQVNVTHLPDMRVLSQFINPSLLNPEPGEPISLSVTYENIGTTNLADNMQLSVLVDDVPLASVPVTGLGTGENATVAIPVPWSSTVVGPHIIRTIIDSNNQVAESNETNNEATRAIVVGEAANLYFQSLAASNPSPSMGAPITINATIGNNGDLDVEADVQFFYMTDGLVQELIGTMHISVANNSSLNIQFPWAVLDPSTTIVVKIINASVLEFTYDDNESTTVLGGMGLTFQATTACTGLDNGTLTVQPSGGTAPYTYEWENGYNGPTLTAAAGTYEVTVTDNTGLSVTASGTILNGSGSTIFYADADGDGFGDPAVTTIACEQPSGYVANDDDCDDTKNTVHPNATEIGYNLIDDDCDGQTDEGFVPKVTVVQGALCGITLATIDTPLVANIVAGAQGYRWKITALNGPNAGQSQILDTALRTMKLTQLVSYAFATQYKVEVGVFYAGYPQPFGVSNCNVTTPSPVTSLANCNQQLSAMADAINANMVSFAAGYRFRVTDPVNPSNTQDIDTNTRQFRMNQITAFAVQYGKGYNVQVAVKNQDGTYLPFGAICNVTTPIFPTTSLQDSQCNSYNVPSTATPLYAISHPGAIAYVFQLTGPGFPSGVEITKSTRSFTLADFTGLTPGATYTVKVRLVFNAADPIGPFGKACTIVTPGALRAIAEDRFDAVAYPNPFADAFGLDVTTSSDQAINVKVYDMAGRLLEDQSVKAARVESVQIGDRYPAGVYNVIVTQGSQTKTLRVVKR